MIKKIPKNYQALLTKDGTYTLRSHIFDENCHSLDGAYQETVHNFLISNKLKDFDSKENEINILELGFGLGYGAKVVFENLNPKFKINFMSFEIDEELILWAKENMRINSTEYPDYSDLICHQSNKLKYYTSTKNESQITIIVGDARDSITKLNLVIKKKFNFIFQDAFSPKKNKKLWTTQWFKELKNVSTKNTILTTYSSATPVRKSLLEAGWFVEQIKGFSGKSTATRANLKENLDIQLYNKISSSSISALSDL